MRSLLFLAVVLGMVLSANAAAAAWGSCPPTFSAPYAPCANITVPEHWANPTGPSVTFLAVRMTTNTVTTPNATIWYLGDGCFSEQLTGWVTSMNQAGFNVVSLYPRGSAFAWPSLQCNSVDSRTGWPLPACGGELTASGIDVSVFSLNETANDIVFAVQSLPTSPVNILVADGLATQLAQRVQTLFPSAFQATVLSGATAPDRFDVIQTALDGFESVARRALAGCADVGNACVAQLGGQDPFLLYLRLLDMSSAGTLACDGLLRWGVPSYRAAYATIVGMLVSPTMDPFTTQSPFPTTAGYFPAFVYRLQRCNPQDVHALTNLFTVLNQTTNPPQAPIDTCQVNSVLRFHQIINEQLQAAPSVSLATVAERSILPSMAFFNALAAATPTWPTYSAPPAVRVYGSTTNPTILITGDADPFTPVELAMYASTAYGANAQFVRIPRGMHLEFTTVMQQPSCITSIVLALATNPQAVVPSCAATAVAPFDFLGQNTASVQQYFGTGATLWAYAAPTPIVPVVPWSPQPSGGPCPSTPSPSTASPSGTQSPTTASPSESSSPSTATAHAAVAFGILCGLTWVGILVYAYRQRGGCKSEKKDFYAQLNS